MLSAFAAEAGSTYVWTGSAGDGKASTVGNWTVGGSVPATAPATGDDISLTSGSVAMTWDAGMEGVKPASWTQDGYTGTVTFETVSTAKGTFNCVEVTGSVILNTGSWTHNANTGLTASNYMKYNRLYVKCGGDFTLGSSGTVTATGLGYGTQLVKIYGLPWPGGTQGGSYGGHGGLMVATSNCTYGCYYAPEDLGNAGAWANNLSGGGAIRLDVAGAFTHNGTISADSRGDTCGGNYSGAGGSVYVTAGSISGTGTMTANAGYTSCPGAGGRIAIILTGKTGGVANGFGSYDVLNLVRAVPLRAYEIAGGCGTIYCETADDTPHEGWLILKGMGVEPVDTTGYPQRKLTYADPFTYQYANLHFAKLTVTNNTLLRVGPGCTLNLTNTVIDAKGNNGFAMDGGTIAAPGSVWELPSRLKMYTPGTMPKMHVLSGAILEFGSTSTFTDDLILSGTLKCKGTDTFTGNLSVLSGGVVTTVGGNSSSGGTTMNLVVDGNVTVAAGGKISMDGKGYQSGSAPQGGLGNGWCGSHGGDGLYCNNASASTVTIPYDSITEPCKGGAGGSNSGAGGGGVIKLTVGGTLTVDGDITSSAGWYQYYPGAGGAVNIRAGRLVGAATGRIKADAYSASYSYSAGGGGRVAVRLTSDGADFSGFAGKITAYGTNNDYGSKKCGGAGTVWLKTAAQQETEGTLIIDNGVSSASGARTVGGTTPLVIDSYNTELSFGDVIIGGRAKVTLAADTLLTVAGSFSNGCQFVTGAGSTVRFVGTNTVHVYDALGTGLDFKKLVCTVPGKNIIFGKGVTVNATELANFTGGRKNRMSLTAESGTWNFNGTGATLVFNDVNLGGCQSTTDLIVQGGKDLGGCSSNITFNNIDPATQTWTGAVDDKWTTVGNWSPSSGPQRVPLGVDDVVIPAKARSPVLTASASCATLLVATGATLDLDTQELTVSSDVTVDGTLIARGDQVITIGGNLEIAGQFVRGRTSLYLNGTEAQAVSSASRFFSLIVQAPAVTFSGAIACDTFTSTASDTRQLLFQNGASLSASWFTVSGASAAKRTVLAPAAAGGAWSLDALVSAVDKVAVTNCDANAGCPVYPTASVGDGNANWFFADTRTAWDGTTELTAGQDLLVGANVTASIASDIALNSIELLSGAKLTITATVPVAEDVVVGANATLVWNRPAAIGGNFVLRAGATLKHDANLADLVNRIDLAFGGSGLVELGSTVSALGGGYAKTFMPGGTIAGLGAGSHGGQAWRSGSLTDSNSTPYGSIVDPLTMGAGSTYSAGGGVVRLSFGGWFAMDGTIAADGAVVSIDAYTSFSGAGGSVNLSSALFYGLGSVHASAGASSPNAVSAGGGRVAIAVTDSSSDFSEIDTTGICAFGRDGAQVGGAGTVLLRANAADADHGDLVVRNRGTATPNVTVVGGDVEGTSFHDVTIRDNAILKLADGATMTVSGVWTNGADFVAGAGSTVQFEDSGASAVYGSNTFARLAIRTKGKTVRFEAGSTQTVTELLTAEGGTATAEYLTLAGVDGASWNLVAEGATVVLSGVSLGGCQSDTPLAVVNGKDLGGNSANVSFVTVSGGSEIVWTGLVDTMWENPDNWNLGRTPLAGDSVLIPLTVRAPTLGADASVAGLTVVAGATLDVGARTLAVSGLASFQGTVTGSAGACLKLNAGAKLGGTWTLAGGTIDLLGTASRAIAVTTPSVLPAVNLSGPIKLTGDLTCDSLTVAAGSSVTLEEGRTLAATKFTVNGSSYAPVTLAASGVWKLVALESDVSCANVSNSDASGGLPVVSPTSTDNGGNVNWLFTDTRVKWIGGASGDFTVAANWSGGAVPTETDDVCIDGATVTLALVASQTNTVKSLALGADAYLLVNGNLATVGSLSVGDGATLEWNRHGTIGGNFVMLSGSTLTHAAGGLYRIDVDITGDGLLSAGSKVGLRGRGYTIGNLKYITSLVAYNAAGSHGGRGYHNNSTPPPCYDSIVDPIHCGLSGGNGAYWGPGGGAVSLVFGGKLTVDGEIDADGGDNNTYYSGAGGAIRLKARDLIGSGSLHANGGQSTSMIMMGGGGRISVVLSEGDFSNWLGTMNCYGGWLKRSDLNRTDGSAGTVFCQAAGARGTLRIENRANTVRRTPATDPQTAAWGEHDLTDFPSEGRIEEVTRVNVVVGTYGTLNVLKDMKIESLAVEGTAPRILLNGHTLRVLAKTPKKMRDAIDEVTTKDGGNIIWQRHGLMILGR